MRERYAGKRGQLAGPDIQDPVAADAEVQADDGRCERAAAEAHGARAAVICEPEEIVPGEGDDSAGLRERGVLPTVAEDEISPVNGQGSCADRHAAHAAISNL